MTAQKKRILIVDDSATARMWQQLLLTHERYTTLTARDGAEGVEVARRERPDLILLDVSMPTMDGFEACRALRAAPETCDIPILMVTTHSEMENVLAGFEAGCNEYITKPLERAEYLVKVRSYLNRHLGDSRMTPRAGCAESGTTDVHRLHDDLANALGDADCLRAQLEQMIATNHNLSALLLSTETRSGEVMKLLVAVRALIESRDARGAIAGVKDILTNVVGAADFTIYSLDPDTNALTAIAGAGAAFNACGRIALAGSRLGEVIRAGQVLITPPDSAPAATSDCSAVAVVPLKVLDRVLGAIVIAGVFPQREALDVCDREVLGLLGAYAATAIIAAERRGEWNALPASIR